MAAVGYAAVAELMSQDPDKETYVFRRFDKLTARNLMNLQGGLIALQNELDMLDAEAARSPDPDTHSSMRSWQIMKEKSVDSSVRKGSEERKRLAIAEQLEVKLRKYHKALLLSRETMKLESPDKRIATTYRYALQDVESDERAKLEEAEDLVVLKPSADRDILSRTLRNHWPFPTLSKSLSRERDKIQYFYERRLVQLISALSVLIAVVLIIGPILALNVTNNTNARLGIAIAFILLFASGLSLSTGVSRDNIFVATATYSAVVVVFVSGNLGDVGNAGGGSAFFANASTHGS